MLLARASARTAAAASCAALADDRARARCCERMGLSLVAARRLTPGSLEAEVVVLERQTPDAPLVRVPLARLVDDLADAERRLVLFGETHDDGVAHAVERAVYAGVARRKKCALALEFVDADARDAARAFSGGATDDVASLFRGPRDAATYGPLARLAAATGNAVVAALAPRRLAKLVAADGPGALARLSASDAALLPPLPYAAAPLSAGYAAALAPFAFSANKVAAQCLWDASMAHACLSTLARDPRTAVFLVCGKFHVQHFLGVVDHVEALTARGGAFAHSVALGRDAFRVVVCLPLDADRFADLRRDSAAAGVVDDRSLDVVADFVVVTRQPPPPRRKTG